MDNTNDHEVIDEAVLGYIQQHAKPTTTLIHLKTISSSMMDENELKMSLGRLWRSVQILRSSASNGHVLYWTESTARVVASSGVVPDMPPGIDVPEFCVPGSRYIEALNNGKEQMLAAANRVPIVPSKAKKRNIGLLVPVSETAKLPMRPLQKGRIGALRRQNVTGKVAMVMFKYRDVRLSIDGVTSLCPTVSRMDVQRVLNTLSTEWEGKDYFTRIPGATRFDTVFQWGTRYSYPFAARQADDGESVPLVNAEDVEDDQPLDHLPPEQLTEAEVESEISRFAKSIVPPTTDAAADTDAPQTVEDAEASTVKDVDDEDDSANYVAAVVIRPPVEPVAPPNLNEPFRAGIFTTGEMVLHIGDTVHQLSKNQTDVLIDLLGPQYLARKAA